MSSVPRIKTSQDWNNFIGNNAELTGDALLMMRKACYSDIEELRGRPLIVYASKFLDTIPGTPNFIDISDIDGFTDLVHSLKGNGSIDALLHSPGGQPDATERIVHILRKKFKEV